MKRALFLASILMIGAASAHAAPAAKDQDLRLLHDCIDDVGGDGSVENGYDLHTLDLREMYDDGNALTFKVILNGAGQATIDVQFAVDGSSKSYKFSGSGTNWGGTFDSVRHLPTSDGDRFILEGTLDWSKIGAKVGSKISAYNAVTDGDSLRENDAQSGLTGKPACQDPSFPDQNGDGTPDAYTLKGPVQFFSQSVQPKNVDAVVNQEVLVQIDLTNKIREAQNIVITADHDGAATVRFHDPVSGEYMDVGRIGLAKAKNSGYDKTLHLVIEGATPGTGTVELDFTSSLGGHFTETVSYDIAEKANVSSSSSSQSTETEDTPFPFLLGALVLLWFARRP